MMKKPWKTHIKCMMPVPSSQSWVAIILSLFFFSSAEIRPKNGNTNTTIHLSTRILGFKSKRWSLGFLRIVQPKIQKSIFSNRIFGFRSKRWIFGFPKVFLDFFGFFERVFGFLGCQVKNPKKLKEKDGFFKKSKKPKEKDGFLQKSKKYLGKRWIFPILISKSKKTQGKRWIFPKHPKNAGKSWIFAKIHLFPWVFLDFWLGNPKIQTPFRRIQKNPKKPWEIQKSIFLTWIQRFCLKRWIFGFLDFWAAG